nr:unnamed protein product [Digitaria exilis]
MAELASGAVSSLLGLLRNEALLLSRVGNDVEFIKEEMESMHSFLEHLARTVPPVGGHDEQVRTWMKQVRDLAHDCSNCIDLYLRRGDPEFYRARGGRWRYLWWASWLVQKMVAQHSAAMRLHELKERARDVGKRRLRYGVEIPGREAGGSAGVPLISSSSQAAAAAAEEAGEEEEDHQYHHSVVAYVSDPRQRVLEPHVLEEYCAEKLANWLKLQAESKKDVSIASIAIVAPDGTEDAGAIARESLTLASANFMCKIWINLSALHLPWDLPLLGWEILAYILRECELQQGKVLGKQRKQDPREQAYHYKDKLEDKVFDMIGGSDDNDYDDDDKKDDDNDEDRDDEHNNDDDDKKDSDNDDEDDDDDVDKKDSDNDDEDKDDDDDVDKKDGDNDDIDEKIEKIKRRIGEVDEGKIGVDRKKIEKTKSLSILLRALRLAQKAPDMGVPLSLEEAMNETASRLKTQIEAGKSKPKICLDVIQYIDILRKVFLANKPLQPHVHEVSPSATTLVEDHIKEIIHNHKITLDIIWDLLQKQQLLEGQMKEILGVVQASRAIAATKNKAKEIAGEVKARSTIINETMEKMDEISEEIENKLFIKGIVDMIKPYLQNKKTLIILQDDKDYISTEDDEDDVSTWKEAINALNLLGCAPGSAVIVSTKNNQKAKEFCYPPGEPVTCSLVGLYHDLVLQLIQQRMYNENDGYNPKILREIMDKCHPHEFCMKVFLHALYANPNRSYAEL